MFSGLSYQRGWDMLQSQMHLGVSETFEPQQAGEESDSRTGAGYSMFLR